MTEKLSFGDLPAARNIRPLSRPGACAKSRPGLGKRTWYTPRAFLRQLKAVEQAIPSSAERDEIKRMGKERDIKEKS